MFSNWFAENKSTGTGVFFPSQFYYTTYAGHLEMGKIQGVKKCHI